MGGSRPNWATVHTWRKAKERGTEDATGKEERHPGQALLERATVGRNLKLKRYLEMGSSAQRSEADLSRLLDGLAAVRAGRERWLREILDACQPD